MSTGYVGKCLSRFRCGLTLDTWRLSRSFIIIRDFVLDNPRDYDVGRIWKVFAILKRLF